MGSSPAHWFMTPQRLCAVALSALALGAAPVAAQAPADAPPPEPIRWTKIGPPPPVNVRHVAFDDDGRPVTDEGERWLPDGTWDQAFEPATFTQFDFYSGSVIYGVQSSLKRSDDAGDTWLTVENVRTLPARTAAGTLIAGARDDTLVRSTNDGVTYGGWDRIPYPPPAFPDGGVAFLPPGTPGVPPAGRAVAVGTDGAAYSDDDGLTWTPSDLWCGRLCMHVGDNALVTLDGGPYDGHLVLSADQNPPLGLPAQVWRSADGAHWEAVGRSFTDGLSVSLAATPGGGLYAYSGGDIDKILASTDGGETWHDVGDVAPDESIRINHVAAGPDGHLYAAGSRFPPNSVDWGGMYRSARPAFVVGAAEGRPSEAAELAVSVRPNPSAGGAGVTVEAASPASSARVTVVDALGRSVATLHDGALAQGRHAVASVPATLPAGRYLVVVEADGRRASAPLSIVN